MKSALEICRANAKTARTKSDADRQAMRARFPFTAAITDELLAAGFKPRVLWMIEGENEWRRV